VIFFIFLFFAYYSIFAKQMKDMPKNKVETKKTPKMSPATKVKAKRVKKKAPVMSPAKGAKAVLLGRIKSLNAEISRKQRAELYQPISDFVTRPIFNQILRGWYVSDNNINLAITLRNALKIMARDNKRSLKSLT
jgi:hypothetical protein